MEVGPEEHKELLDVSCFLLLFIPVHESES